MKCIFCGEKEADRQIPDPNMKEDMVDVCEGCEDWVKRVQSLTLECLLKDRIGEQLDFQKLAKKWMEGKNPKFDRITVKKAKEHQVKNPQ